MGFENFDQKPKGVVAERIFGMPYNDGQEEMEGAGDEQYSNSKFEELVTEAHNDKLEAELEAEQERLDFIKNGSEELPEAQRGGRPSHNDHKDASKQRTAYYGHELHSQRGVDWGGHPSVTPKRKTEAYAQGAHNKKMMKMAYAKAQMSGADEIVEPSHLRTNESDEDVKKFKDAA